jgi:RHS repeat-associated protein
VQPYAFSGEPLDQNTGLQYHRARWLDTGTGRFLGMDSRLQSPMFQQVINQEYGHSIPAPNSGDVNYFGYAYSDPVNFVDPSGEIGTANLLSLSAGYNQVNVQVQQAYAQQKFWQICYNLTEAGVLIGEKTVLEAVIHKFINFSGGNSNAKGNDLQSLKEQKVYSIFLKTGFGIYHDCELKEKLVKFGITEAAIGKNRISPSKKQGIKMLKEKEEAALIAKQNGTIFVVSNMDHIWLNSFADGINGNNRTSAAIDEMLYTSFFVARHFHLPLGMKKPHIGWKDGVERLKDALMQKFMK